MQLINFTIIDVCVSFYDLAGFILSGTKVNNGAVTFHLNNASRAQVLPSRTAKSNYFLDVLCGYKVSFMYNKYSE